MDERGHGPAHRLSSVVESDWLHIVYAVHIVQVRTLIQYRYMYSGSDLIVLQPQFLAKTQLMLHCYCKHSVLCID